MTCLFCLAGAYIALGQAAEKEAVDHFAHLRPAHREIVRDWLRSKPSLRPAVEKVDSWVFSEEWKKDFKDNYKFLRETVGKGGYQYYAVGDMNGDKQTDFAVLLADTRKPATEHDIDRFALAIFNAPFRKGQQPAYFEEGLAGISNSYISYNQLAKKRLFLGKFESDVYCATYYPKKKTYYFKDCLDDE